MNDLVRSLPALVVLACLGQAVLLPLSIGLTDGLVRLAVRSPLRAYRIQPQPPSPAVVRAEWRALGIGLIANCALAAFAAWLYWNGSITIDMGPARPGAVLAQVLAYFVGMDAQQYLVHRLMHTRWLLGTVHAVHHRSRTPHPLSAFSFHPVELLLLGSYFPMVLAAFDLHVAALAILGPLQFFLNTVPHCGFEGAPRWWYRNPLSRLLLTPAFHDVHHLRPMYNYGAIFTIWDRAFGTMQPGFEERYERNRPASAPGGETVAWPWRRVKLADGTRVHCLKRMETQLLDAQIDGYFRHGIRVGPGDVIVDVGANIGLFGLRALQRTEGRARVVAVEPIPAIHDVLAKNAAEHHPERWTLLRCGLSSAPGRRDFTYYPQNPAISTAWPETYDQEPALLFDSVNGVARSPPATLAWARWLPAWMCALIARGLRRGGQRVSCEVRTLSDLMAERDLVRIDLLKVDVEGEELEVLRGIRDEDWPRIRAVVVEVHDRDGRLDAVRALLGAHGLEVLAVDKERGFEALPFFDVFARRLGGATP